MQLKEMYEKPIDRDIKGVIKVGQDDNENIKQELEEYVLTDEIYKYINDFYDSYKKSLVDYTKWGYGYQDSLVLVNHTF